MFLKLLFFIAMILALGGCSRTEEPASKVNANVVSSNAVTTAYSKVEPSQLLVAVNDHVLTKRDVENEVDLQIKLYDYKEKSKSKRQRLRKNRENLARSIVSSYIPRMILVDIANTSNYQPTAEMRVAYENRVLKTFNVQGMTFDQFCKSLGPQEKYLRVRIENDLLTENFLKNTYSNELTFTEEDIDHTIVRFKRLNDAGIATNKLVRVFANEICKRAKGGEDFAKLANTYSQDADKEPGGDLGECTQNSFQLEPEIWNHVFNLKAGEVSDVIETKYGFYIYKCRERASIDDNNASTIPVLSEIYFKKAMDFPERTREELRAEGEKQQREELLKRLFKEHREKLRIRAPNMKVLFPKRKK